MKNRTLQFKENLYHPTQKNLWVGRQDDDIRFYKIVSCQDFANEFTIPKGITFGLIGFCCDEGVKRNQGRAGAAKGPEAIRKALADLPFDLEHIHIWDFGDIHCLNGDLEEAQAHLGEAVAFLLSHKIRPIVLGGGHETAWGTYQGIASIYPKEEIGIINFDSHFDLRPLLAEEKGSSGTSFRQIAEARQSNNQNFDYCCLGIQKTGNTKSLFQKASELNVKILLADEFQEGSIEFGLEMIEDFKTRNDYLYTSICLDVFASPFAPGVSSLQPLGLFPWHVVPMIRRLAESGKVLGLDIAELCPPLDRDQTTAKLGALLISNFIQHSV